MAALNFTANAGIYWPIDLDFTGDECTIMVWMRPTVWDASNDSAFIKRNTFGIGTDDSGGVDAIRTYFKVGATNYNDFETGATESMDAAKVNKWFHVCIRYKGDGTEGLRYLAYQDSLDIESERIRDAAKTGNISNSNHSYSMGARFDNLNGSSISTKYTGAVLCGKVWDGWLTVDQIRDERKSMFPIHRLDKLIFFSDTSQVLSQDLTGNFGTAVDADGGNPTTLYSGDLPVALLRPRRVPGLILPFPSTTIISLSLSNSSSTGSIETLSVTENHDLTLASTSSTGSVADVLITQDRNLLITSVNSTGNVDTVSITQNHDLVAASINSSSSIDNILIAQNHALTVTNLTSTGNIDTVVATQSHNLAVGSLASTDEINSLAITQDKNLTLLSGNSTANINTTSITVNHNLIVAGTNSAGSVADVLITQDKNLTLLGVNTTGSIDATPITQNHNLTGASANSSSSIDNTLITQGINLIIAGTNSAASVDTASITQNHDLEFTGYFVPALNPKQILSSPFIFTSGYFKGPNTSISGEGTLVGPDGTLGGAILTNDGGNFNYLFGVASGSAGLSKYVADIVVQAGDGVPESATHQIGIYFQGVYKAATGTIISGPGSVSGTDLQSVTGLSQTEWTHIKVVLDAETSDAVTVRTFPAEPGSVSSKNNYWYIGFQAGIAPGDSGEPELIGSVDSLALTQNQDLVISEISQSTSTSDSISITQNHDLDFNGYFIPASNPKQILTNPYDFTTGYFKGPFTVIANAGVIIGPDGTLGGASLSNNNDPDPFNYLIGSTQGNLGNVRYVVDLLVRASNDDPSSGNSGLSLFHDTVFSPCTGTIISGPGTISGTTIIEVSGLSETLWTHYKVVSNDPLPNATLAWSIPARGGVGSNDYWYMGFQEGTVPGDSGEPQSTGSINSLAITQDQNLLISEIASTGNSFDVIISQNQDLILESIVGTGQINTVEVVKAIALSADNLFSDGIIGSVTIDQDYNLTIPPLSLETSTDNVAITQGHDLAISLTSSIGALDAPLIAKIITLSNLNVVMESNIIGVSITQNHNLITLIINSISELSDISLTQNYNLLVSDVLLSSTLNAIELTQGQNLSITTTESNSQNFDTSVTQIHNLSSEDIENIGSIFDIQITKTLYIFPLDIQETPTIDDVSAMVGQVLVLQNLSSFGNIDGITFPILSAGYLKASITSQPAIYFNTNISNTNNLKAVVASHPALAFDKILSNVGIDLDVKIDSSVKASVRNGY